MIESRKIGSLTELYINGGGVFTESFPTYHHNFYTRKILLDGESADDFKEITAAEKTKIENADKAARERGEGVRIALTPLYEANGAVFNDRTGYYELNGLTDITETEMASIYKWKIEYPYPKTLDYANIRTNILVSNTYSEWDKTPDLRGLVREEAIEILKLSSDQNSAYSVRPSYINSVVTRATRLRAILGEIDLSVVKDNAPIMPFGPNDRLMSALETVLFKNIKKSMNISNCPVLLLDSISFMVSKAANTSAITITVHPAVMAKLAGAKVRERKNFYNDAQWKQYVTVGNETAYIQPAEPVEKGDYVIFYGNAGDSGKPYYFIGKVTSTEDGAKIKTLYGAEDEIDYDRDAWTQVLSAATEKQINFATV